MPVGRHKREQLAPGVVLAKRVDPSRLAVVVSVAPKGSKTTAEILTPDGAVHVRPAPYGYLPTHGEWLKQAESLDPEGSAPFVQQLRTLIADRRRAAVALAEGPTMSRYEAAHLAQVRVQAIDRHRLAGHFAWAKCGAGVAIDRTSFMRWLAQRPRQEEGIHVAEVP